MNDIMIEIWDIENIHPYKSNPRKNDSTIEILAKHIRKVGFNVPLVVDTDGVIVKGHARYNAALSLNYKKLPVIVSQNSDEINNFDRVADNLIHDKSDWNNDILAYELESIREYMDELGIEWKLYSDNLVADTLKVTESQLTYAQSKIDKFGDKVDNRNFVVLKCKECGGVIKYASR